MAPPASTNPPPYCGGMFTKRFDRRPLDERTQLFAISVRKFAEKLAQVPQLAPDIEELGKSSGSVGSHYIGAKDAISIRAFTFHMKMCRKESREAFYWLMLLRQALPTKRLQRQCDELLNESTEFIKIFSTIIKKCEPTKEKIEA